MITKRNPTKKQLAARRRFVAAVRAGKFARKARQTRRKNVAAGFRDEDGVFHPIRASHDYDPKRADESWKPSRRYKAAVKKRYGTPKRKRKNPPTRKQLAARRKFVAMVRRRAKELRAKKRAKRNGIVLADRIPGYFDTSVRGGGNKSFRRAKAKGLIKKHSGRPGMGRYARGGALYKTARGKLRQQAWFERHRSGSDRLPNPKRTYNMFRGRPARSTYNVITSNRTPSIGLKEAGPLEELRLRGGKTLRFSPKAKVLYKGNRLYIGGVRFKRSNPPGEVDYGEITHIAYHADKQHLEGDTKSRCYEHKFGEEGGQRPHLIVDEEGLPYLEGGDYRVTAEGIVD